MTFFFSWYLWCVSVLSTFVTLSGNCFSLEYEGNFVKYLWDRSRFCKWVQEKTGEEGHQVRIKWKANKTYLECILLISFSFFRFLSILKLENTMGEEYWAFKIYTSKSVAQICSFSAPSPVRFLSHPLLAPENAAELGEMYWWSGPSQTSV